MSDKTTGAGHGKAKERVGIVTSDRRDKTITVKVDRRVRHPLYDKVITKFAKFHAHDPENSASEGDRVLIRETRPMSRTKRWELVEILEKSKTGAAE